MKYSKLIWALSVACFLFIPQAIFAQTETFDIIQYTPPKGWTKNPKEGAMAFIDVNTKTNGFCILTIFKSSPSAGSAQKDFANEWDGLLVKPFRAAANPKTETQNTPEGWQVTVGAGEIEVDGAKSIAILTVFSGFGKTASILANLNDESYMAQVDAVISGIKLDKNAQASASVSAPQAAVSPNNNSGKYGSMTYTPPPGWSEQQFSDGIVFKPLDLVGENLTILVMRPLNATGTMEQALAQSWSDAAAVHKATPTVVANVGYYDKTEAKRSFNGWEYIQGRGTVQLENGTPYKTPMGLTVFVVRVNNRFERVEIAESLTCNRPSNRVKYNNPIENFLFSMQFADLNEPVLKPGLARGAGILGVWQGIALAVGMPTTGAGLGVGSEVYSPIFLTNGQAYFGTDFLFAGLDGVDSRVEAELHRRDWGTYTFNNGRGVLKMPYGEFPLRMEGNKLIITKNQADHAFIKMTPVDGATFSGTYTFSEYKGKIPTISFTPDGRFNDNGAIEIMYHVSNECLSPAEASGSGTYEVKDFTVTFSYSDGRTIKIPFLGVGYDKSNTSPPTLIFSSVDQKFIRR
jgi:hypothetical protein